MEQNGGGDSIAYYSQVESSGQGWWSLLKQVPTLPDILMQLEKQPKNDSELFLSGDRICRLPKQDEVVCLLTMALEYAAFEEKVSILLKISVAFRTLNSYFLIVSLIHIK